MSKNQEIIAKAFELSQQRLGVQLETANFADQRAMTFAGLQVATTAILATLSAGNWMTSFAAALMLAGAIMSFYTVLPSKMYVAGSKFSDLEDDFEAKKSITDVYLELGAFTDEAIGKNEDIRKKANDIFKASFALSVIALAFAVLGSL